MPVDDALRDEACAALGVLNPVALKHGGQKSVFQVDGPLVVKVIEVSTSSPDAVRRAEREVELLQGVDSAFVVKVASDLIELGSPTRAVAWLEEYLDGEDLAALLGTQWTWADASTMGVHLSKGLGALHALRVVHRDLSPSNVRKTTAGNYVVMDPGYARHELRSGLTIGGHPGTPGFASPEHLYVYSGSPTPFADVFCVGALMFAALTCEPPIPYRGDEADYVRRLSVVEKGDIRGARPDLSDEQHALIERCLHPQPARRFRNGTDLADALEGLP